MVTQPRKRSAYVWLAAIALGLSGPAGNHALGETLSPLAGKAAPSTWDDLWADFDPRAEPLDTQILHQWDEDSVSFRIVRFRMGVFKGQDAWLAAIYGFPKNLPAERRIPGLLQIHGGGQYADANACRTNAERGYATLSIAWAGRISAPDYSVTPAAVKLFWRGESENPTYRVTTDWGAVDGYHAPERHAGKSFPTITPTDWTLDPVESPRNSGWFLCVLAARRALTFLEQQPEVDARRLGVYGHSMGGKLTVMTAVDPRVKAAAPSCGGISDRDHASEIYRNTLGDPQSLARVGCPIIFLSPANDFHGRIGDLPAATKALPTGPWRITCAPHHNHQDTPAFEVATQLWFDEHLKDAFTFPQTPATTLQLETSEGRPQLQVQPDQSLSILEVDVFYTQHGKPRETPRDMTNTTHRFWHHVKPREEDAMWVASLPLADTAKPLWVYANVRYALESPVTAAGYYYRTFTSNTVNVSSPLHQVSPEELQAAGIRSARAPSPVIESFDDGWEKEWFTYRPEKWARSTHKIYDARYQAPAAACLALQVRSAEANRLVIRLDDAVAEVALKGGSAWETVKLLPADFVNIQGEPLASFVGTMRLTLSEEERLRPPRGSDQQPQTVGAPWRGGAPEFRQLRWVAP